MGSVDALRCKLFTLLLCCFCLPNNHTYHQLALEKEESSFSAYASESNKVHIIHPHPPSHPSAFTPIDDERCFLNTSAERRSSYVEIFSPSHKKKENIIVCAVWFSRADAPTDGGYRMNFPYRNVYSLYGKVSRLFSSSLFLCCVVSRARLSSSGGEGNLVVIRLALEAICSDLCCLVGQFATHFVRCCCEKYAS